MTNRDQLIGFTGHQTLSSVTRDKIVSLLNAQLATRIPSTGICSLAAGADQLFAAAVLRNGHELAVVIPCNNYVDSFENQADRDRYLHFLSLASGVEELAFDEPSEEAYFAAGTRIVQRANLILAVWDGAPSGGLGGTADIVRVARQEGVEVRIIWPPGGSRV